MSTIDDSVIARFWQKVKKTDSCWLWTTPGTNGYGYIGINRKTYLTHRLSWTIHNGPIASGLFVLHKCDVRNCVNPSHLFLGTDKDNCDDKIRKGRDVILRGEQAGQAKLTDAAVMDIRQGVAAGQPIAVMARKHNISLTAVRVAVRGETWKHLPILGKPDNAAPKKLNAEGKPLMVWQATVEVLKETNSPGVMWGDVRLLHLIADKMGWEHDAWRTEKRVLKALTRTPGPLVKEFVQIHRLVRLFRLPEQMRVELGIADWTRLATYDSEGREVLECAGKVEEARQ